MIIAVNIRNPDAVYDLYAGRENKYKGLAGSKWGNPFHMTNETDRPRVLREYEAHIRNTPELWNALEELDGLRLGCWCAAYEHKGIKYPGKKCHVDVLNELLIEKKCKATKENLSQGI